MPPQRDQIVQELEKHPGVNTVLTYDGITVVTDWNTQTETIREVVEIAGCEGEIYGGDTRLHIKFDLASD